MQNVGTNKIYNLLLYLEESSLLEQDWSENQESCEYHVQKDEGGICVSGLKRQVEGGYLLQGSL